MLSTVYRAMMFAKARHGTQVRKYNGQPYWMHLAEVAGIVGSVSGWVGHEVKPADILATAWLHDTVEDTETDITEIEAQFGPDIMHGVWLLTDPPLTFGNRQARVTEQARRLAAAPAWVQSVKFADMISNTVDIVQHDPDFAKLYLKEKALGLEGMTKGNPSLRAIAGELIGVQ